jgi:tetratricopeptide (TPR) repeat protein
MTAPVPDSVLAQARTAAARGAWGIVRATLEGDAAGTEKDGTRAVLLADACLWTGDPQAAARWLDRALPLLAQAGDRPALRRSVNMQGAAAFAIGALDQASDRFSQALALAISDDDALLTARATNNLGLIESLRGNADQSIASYQRAIMTYQRLGNPRGLAESWHNLAISFRTRGELDAAEDAERRAIEFANEAANPRLATMALVGRAEISLRRGDFAWARATAARAATVFASLPDFLLQADAVRAMADAADRMGLTAVSDDAIATALQLSREHEHRTQEAQALQTQAQMMARRGDAAAARRIGIEAREAFSALGSVTAAEEMAEFLAGLTR